MLIRFETRAHQKRLWSAMQAMSYFFAHFQIQSKRCVWYCSTDAGLQ